MPTLIGDAINDDDEGDGGSGSSLLWDVLVTVIAGLSLMGVTWLLKYMGCYCTESLTEDETPPPRFRWKWPSRSTNPEVVDPPSPVVSQSQTSSL